MLTPRRAAVAGALVAAAWAVAVPTGRTPAPPPPAAPAVPVGAGPSAQFHAPLFVPAPPAGVPAPQDGTGLLGPGSVLTPVPAPAVAPRAVIRPA